nr:unnamed protein product [Spirometra erinaceieuropaei]
MISPDSVMQESPRQATTSNELAQRLANLPFASAVADKDASMENRWCQLRNTDWFGDNDAFVSNLPAEKSRLHKFYVNCPPNDNKAAFYHSRFLVQQRLREMQEVWTAHKAGEVQGYANRKRLKNLSAIEAVYGPAAKGTAFLLSSNGTTIPTGRRLFCSNGPDTSEASSAVPSSPLTPPSPVYLSRGRPATPYPTHSSDSFLCSGINLIDVLHRIPTLSHLSAKWRTNPLKGKCRCSK